MSELLYHFCNTDVFFNIIKNSTIWLSDVSKSNDYQECVLCLDLVNREMEKFFSSNAEDLDAWKDGFDIGRQVYEGITTFCACFSDGQDQLSQWRGYADNGAGLSIGFDKTFLLELNTVNKCNIAFSRVIYDDIQAYVNRLVKSNIHKLSSKGIGHIALELPANYRLKFPFIKNPSFKEEREWRAVVCSSIDNHNIRCAKNFSFSKINYRVAHKQIIPYIEMNFSQIKQQLIKEIWIGPKSKITISDIVHLLNFYGYYDGIAHNSEHPILIRESSCSYR